MRLRYGLIDAVVGLLVLIAVSQGQELSHEHRIGTLEVVATLRKKLRLPFRLPGKPVIAFTGREVISVAH